MSDDLAKKIEAQRAAFSLNGFRKAVVQGYSTLGGSLPEAREIALMGLREFLEKDLNEADLPGPDSLKPVIIPKILEVVTEAAGKYFDKLTSL